MADTPNIDNRPSDPLIATLWSQWMALYAARTTARGPAGTNRQPELDMRLRALALMIASVPATSWSDVLPKVTVAAMMRDEDEPEASHLLEMIEAAVEIDHENLQPVSDEEPRRH